MPLLLSFEVRINARDEEKTDAEYDELCAKWSARFYHAIALLQQEDEVKVTVAEV